MSRLTINVDTFRMDTDKEAALKPLEEAAEAFGAFQSVSRCEGRESSMCRLNMYPNTKQVDCQLYVDLADEIADVIQAACNLADRHGIDLQAAMERCEERNRKRGRYEGEQAVR